MFENILNTILTKVDKTKKVTYLTGDFNIDLLNLIIANILTDSVSNFSHHLFSHLSIDLLESPIIQLH